MNLQKNELISKLEKISILFKEALSIRIRIEEFTPEDNYERKVNVPVFPGNYKNSNEREYWENLVDHSDIDAIEEMADRYDGVYSPDEPKKPVTFGVLRTMNQAFSSISFSTSISTNT